MQNFRALGAPPPDPQNSPPLRISGYAPVLLHVLLWYFRKKSKQCDCHPRKKGLVASLWFKSHTRSGFLKIRYYATSVVITPFFKIKHQNALRLFVSGKLRFSWASRHLLWLAQQASCKESQFRPLLLLWQCMADWYIKRTMDTIHKSKST